MRTKTMLVALAVALSVLLVTTQALAGSGATGLQAAGGTPGAPGKFPTPTGTLLAQPMQGPPPNAGKPSGVGPPITPGAPPQKQARPHGKPMIYMGTISDVEASSLTLTLMDNSSVTIGLTGDTRIFVPGPASEGDTLLVGMRVIVWAFADENGNPVARAVVAIPGQPTRVHRVGTVTAYTPGSSITIQATDGNSYTFALTAETKILPPERAGSLAVGSRVTIIAPRDPASLIWTATGIVVQPPGS